MIDDQEHDYLSKEENFPSTGAYSVEWVEINDYGLREAAAMVGINPSFFEKIKGNRFKALEDKSRDLIAHHFIKNIEAVWAESSPESANGRKLSSIKCGVYVITLGYGYEVDYGNDYSSPVLYVGKGSVRSRLRHHAMNKLFDFWKSIHAVPFRFHIASLDNHENPPDASYALESHLLAYFDERRPDERITPLLNKKQGPSEPKIPRSEFASNWERPIKRIGRGRRATSWLLRPSNGEYWKGKLEGS